jgi:GT2 family glycosyltransferase
MSELGVVVIGRNEGDRLRRCLESLAVGDRPVVYVDSGSTDGSVALARSRGVEVVELDMAMPFTAARARNAGVERLAAVAPGARFVQFVDGDCEVVSGWLDRGRAEMEARPKLAVVCGRLRERFPERSIYNRLADLEWDTPVGEVAASGGIAMVRLNAFHAAGGFDPTLIAGEEPELCLRLRFQGWKILRVDAEMALHDIAMTRFGQWWRRSVRGGYAYAEGAARHGRSPQRHWVRETRSFFVWGLLLPLVIVGLSWPTRGASLALGLVYPVLVARTARGVRARGWSGRDTRLYGTSCILAKFPQAVGAVCFWSRRLAGRRGGLIEYKQ